MSTLYPSLHHQISNLHCAVIFQPNPGIEILGIEYFVHRLIVIKPVKASDSRIPQQLKPNSRIHLGNLFSRLSPLPSGWRRRNLNQRCASTDKKCATKNPQAFMINFSGDEALWPWKFSYPLISSNQLVILAFLGTPENFSHPQIDGHINENKTAHRKPNPPNIPKLTELVLKTYHSKQKLANLNPPYINTPYIQPIRFNTHTSISPLIQYSQNIPNQTMAGITLEDEALIQKFIGLQTDDQLNPIFQLPKQATTATNWNLSILAKIVTTRTVQDAPFSSAMITAWRADPATVLRPIGRNCYHIEFTNDEDAEVAIRGGPWTFRGDLVAIRKANSQADLNPNHINRAELWVQFYHIPVNQINEEGVLIIAGKIGMPVSLPIEGYVGGKRFIKVKIILAFEEELKDRLRFTHPTLGTITTFCCYEKIARICSFCAKMGHDTASCADLARLTILVCNTANSSIAGNLDLLKPKRGLWMCNSSLIPRPEVQQTSTSKRQQPHHTIPLLIQDSTMSETNHETEPNVTVNIPNKRLRQASHKAPAKDI